MTICIIPPKAANPSTTPVLARTVSNRDEPPLGTLVDEEDDWELMEEEDPDAEIPVAGVDSWEG